MPAAKRADWRTPLELYLALDAEFVFELDAAATPQNALCARYITPEEDALVQPWAPFRTFCNPPYGRGVAAWLAKATEAELAVYLIPSRTETIWWHEYAMKANEIRFLRGRLKFGGAKFNAPFPSVVLIYRRAPAGEAPLTDSKDGTND